MFDKNDAIPRAPPGLEKRLQSFSAEKEELNNANNQVRNHLNLDNDLMSVSGTLSQTTISQDQHQHLVERMMSSQHDIMNQALHGTSIHSQRSSSSGINSVGSTTNNQLFQDHNSNDRDLYQAPTNDRNPFIFPERLRTRDNGEEDTFLIIIVPSLFHRILTSTISYRNVFARVVIAEDLFFPLACLQEDI